jgi:hypothetical protein
MARGSAGRVGHGRKDGMAIGVDMAMPHGRGSGLCRPPPCDSGVARLRHA